MDRVDGSFGPLLISPRSPHSKKKKDFELEAGARAHFEDPLYYSHAYDERVEDAVYYCSIVETRGITSVLEYGIGNGRIALPLARLGSGVHVTGIDHSKAMLDDLRARLKREPPEIRKLISLHQGDMRTKKLTGQFELVTCPFNAALHLYTREDVESWLARVREHLLAPNGELVFDISMPILEDLSRKPEVPYRIPSFVHPTKGPVSYREYFDYDRVRQILFVSMYFEPQPPRRKGGKSASKITEGFMTPLAHRQFYPQEIEALLHYNGFEIVELYGDFMRGPLIPRSDVMVFHARPRNRKKAKAKKAARR